MLDIDAVIDGKQGSPRLSDLLAMAEKKKEKNGDEGADGKVISHLEMQTNKDGTQKIKPSKHHHDHGEG